MKKPYSALSSRLTERIQVLSFTPGGGDWEWAVQNEPFADVEFGTTRNLYSTYGVGSARVTFTIRRQELTLGHAIRWNGGHYLVTGIIPPDRYHLVVETARVEIARCKNDDTGESFPAVVAEKYLRHDDPAPMSINTLRYVLITPKVIQLTPGKLVDVDGEPWEIMVAHTLDFWKNEYEIGRTVEL